MSTPTLAYERIGSGEPVLMIHGIGHRRQAWHSMTRRHVAERVPV